jgi:hypothetical protein
MLNIIHKIQKKRPKNDLGVRSPYLGRKQNNSFSQARRKSRLKGIWQYKLSLSYLKEHLKRFKKFINNSRGKYKRNECLINVCKSVKDLS